jgi:sugar lactone lactonase YvrE
VRHCLEKSPEQRFHSAHDLAFDLQALSETSAPRGRTAAPEGRRAFGLARIAAALAVLAAIGLAFLAGRRTNERPLPSFRQLTFRRGSISAARFAPDRQSVVYTAVWEGNRLAVFTNRIGSPEATSLELPEATLLGISSTGELALQLAPRFLRGFTFAGTLARVPLAGGVPRELLENVHWADWVPDGRELAVVRDAEGKNRLEFPAGKPVYSTAGFITHPRVSRKGDLVAFLDHPTHGDDAGFVAVVDSAGRKRTLSSRYGSIFGLAWSPDGSEVWFTGSPAGSRRSLRAVTLSGRERSLAESPGALTLYDTAPGGLALVSHETLRVGMMGLGPGETKERDLSWFDWSLGRDLSADGRTLLFGESGEGAAPSPGVYLRKMDGSPAVRLGDGGPMALSPDGKWVLAITPLTPPAQLVLLPTGAGQPRKVTEDTIDHVAAAFVAGGKRFVFAGHEPGRGMRLYVQDLSGGKPRALSPEGMETSGIVASPDGKWVTGVDTERRV